MRKRAGWFVTVHDGGLIALTEGREVMALQGEKWRTIAIEMAPS